MRRALPRTIQIDIAERTPIAFLRDGSDMALVDAHGVIFDRPLQGQLSFSGGDGIQLGHDCSRSAKSACSCFTGFLQGLASARAGAVEQVSEVDLSDAHDLRASLTGLQAGNVAGAGSPLANSSEASSDPDAPILVHFGDSDFESKYETLMDKMGQWRATAGRVESVDLRFNGEAVVNSDTPAVARVQQPSSPPQKRADKARKR